MGHTEGFRRMPTRNVVLTHHHEKIIADLVGSGRYRDSDDSDLDALIGKLGKLASERLRGICRGA